MEVQETTTVEESMVEQGCRWPASSFAKVLNRQCPQPLLYTGEGEEDSIDDLGLDDILQNQEAVAEGELCPIVDILWEAYKKSWQPWRRALIIRVLGKSFNFCLLEPRVRKLWQLDHGCKLIDMDKGYMVARFYSQQDYLKVINGGPWMVMNHYLTISKWKPNFKPGETEITPTLVWLRFPLLPLEMFVEANLLSAGNAVGRAVKVDPITADMIKGRYARVCVELDFNGPLPPNVLLWGRKQTVEYEGLHHICYLCGKYGHKKEYCPSTRQSTGDASEPTSPAPMHQKGGTASQPFGPWMLPAHGRRKQQLAQARMSRRSMPSEANRRLNADIEK